MSVCSFTKWLNRAGKGRKGKVQEEEKSDWRRYQDLSCPSYENRRPSKNQREEEDQFEFFLLGETNRLQNELPQKPGFNRYQSRHCAYMYNIQRENLVFKNSLCSWWFPFIQEKIGKYRIPEKRGGIGRKGEAKSYYLSLCTIMH